MVTHMTYIRVPDWLVSFIEKNGNEAGPYTFSRTSSSESSIQSIDLTNLPEEFAGIAEDGQGEGLAVAVKYDGVVYRLQDGEVFTYAINEAEFIIALQRDTRWDELAENMPALQSYWLGIILKTTMDDGRVLTLGYRGELHYSALIVRANVKAGEMLVDALDRELLEVLDIEDYTVIDLIDDGGVVDIKNVEEPLFTVTVNVSYFDIEKLIQDQAAEWVELDKKRIVN